jgi:hypothetical protein
MSISCSELLAWWIGDRIVGDEAGQSALAVM